MSPARPAVFLWRVLPASLRRRWVALSAMGVLGALAELALAAQLWAVLREEGPDGGAALLVLLVALRLVLRLGEALGGGRLAERSVTALVQPLLGGSLAGGWRQRQQMGTQALVQRVTSDAETVVQNGFLALARAAAEGLTALVLVAASLVVGGPRVLLPALLLALLAALAVGLLRARHRRWSGSNHRNWLARRDLVAALHAGSRELALSGAGDAFLRHNRALREEAVGLRAEAVWLREAPALAMESLFLLVMLALLLGAGAAGGDTLFFAYAGLRLLPTMLRLLQALNDWRGATAAFGAVAGELAAHPPPEAVAAGPGGPAPVTALRLERVAFGYRGSPLFSGLSLEWRHGEWLGITGPTGAGKSTLLHLVTGLLEPGRGAVRVDGRALDATRVAWWRTMAFVPQEPFVFEDTLYANLSLVPGALPADAAQERAARAALEAAGLPDWPECLADGWAARLGEAGVRLSGGQRQRLALARALLRRPRFLVLDEPSAALDALTEGALIARLRERVPAVLVVSHRPAWLAACDRVLILRDGRLLSAVPVGEHM